METNAALKYDIIKALFAIEDTAKLQAFWEMLYKNDNGSKLISETPPAFMAAVRAPRKEVTLEQLKQEQGYKGPGNFADFLANAEENEGDFEELQKELELLSK